MFGAKKHRAALAALEQENSELRSELQRLGAYDAVHWKQELSALREQCEQQRSKFVSDQSTFTAKYEEQRKKLEEISAQIVETDDARMLQEVGVYHYRHVLANAEEYKKEIATIRRQVATMVKGKVAINSSAEFTFNNSRVQGEKFVRDLSKLMLRAYNAEADVCARVLKSGNLDSAVKRLEVSVRVIEKLGSMASISVSSSYHGLRVRELELTADYLAKKQEEKEEERDRRARLREEQVAQREFERKQQQLAKEKRHYENAIDALRVKGGGDDLGELEVELERIEQAIHGIEERQANRRAGYVYVISNIGSFGEGVVKVGMTRRLDPMDRIRELGDASVPFRFDVHALFFSDDAVGIESEIHRQISECRMNKVNRRREFFQTTPERVKSILVDLAGNILDYVDEPEATEYRQSLGEAPAGAL